jgi:asparagine synthase (glutamine-hydrolysing)
MCGITLLINKKSTNKIDLESFTKMNNSITHRGPDSESYALISDNNDYLICNTVTDKNNYFTSLYALFGFRRLSILDLSDSGNQPMEYLNKYIIVFNGEIYNYIELREELKLKGYSFKTNTDTEVIVAAYDFWKEKCLEKFNGMWAIIILELSSGNFFISRDRFGIKPLYFYQDEEKICFVSEIKQLKYLNENCLKPNINKIKSNFNKESEEYGLETDFENVFRFPNANYCIINNTDTRINFINYYQLPPINESSEEYSEIKAVQFTETYYDLLEDAVKLRLRSDVKIGTCLSGGLDSTSIAYLINKQFEKQGLKELQNTFSLVFTNQKMNYCDESFQINEIAEQLNLNKHFIEPTIYDVKKYYPKIVYHMDNIQHSSLMSYCITYKLVNEHGLKVTLDGQGADELQGGYIYYLLNFFSNCSFRNLYHNFRDFKQIPDSNKYIYQGVFFNLLKRLGLKNTAKKILKKLKIKTDPFISVNEAMRIDFESNLQTLLHYGDRGSMMNSVESRFPFLDYRMVEFWQTLPACYKIHNGHTKYIARKAFDKKLPDSIVWKREKKGWEIPHKEWLDEGLLSDIKDEINSGSFIKKLEKLDYFENAIKEDKTKKSIKAILKCYNAELWNKIFFK